MMLQPIILLIAFFSTHFDNKFYTGLDRIKNNSSISFSEDFHISGNIKELATNGTVIIRIWKNIINKANPEMTPYKEYKSKLADGYFSSSIEDIHVPVYFSLYYSNDSSFDLIKNINLYLAEPGDQIYFILESESVHFYGNGSTKYNCRQALDSLKYELIRKANRNSTRNKLKQVKYYDTSLTFDWVKKTIKDFAQYNLTLENELSLLNHYKPTLTSCSYQIIVADIIGENMIKKLYAIKSSNSRLEKLKGMAERKNGSSYLLKQKLKLKRLYNKTFTNIDFQNMPEDILNISKNYSELMFLKALQDIKYLNKTPYQGYFFIKNKFKGNQRDKLLGNYFLQKYNDLTNGNILTEDALSFVKNKDCRVLIRQISNQGVGMKAFNFLLPDDNDKMVSLNQFKGKVIILDFWFTGCIGCSEFYENVLSPVEDKFKTNNQVIFISISIDYNKGTWIKSISKNIYTSGNKSNVVNLYTDGKGYKHAVIKHYNIETYPRPFIIDKNGNIFSNNETQLRTKDILSQLILDAIENKMARL